MTADDIIKANPEYGYQPATIGGMTGLKGKHPDTGAEHWCVFSGASHVAAPGPWTWEQIKAAATNLAGAAATEDRTPYIERPNPYRGMVP